MQHNKPISTFLLFVFLAGLTQLSGQESTSYRITNGQLISSAAQPSSSGFKLRESNLGVFCPGKAESAHFRLNSSFIGVTAMDSSFLFYLVPGEFQLQQNYPNPFNPTTTIRYHLPKMADVKITIFNAAGQVIRTLSRGEQQPGVYQMEWDGKNELGHLVASGIYYYQIKAADIQDTKKMLLIK